MELLGVLATLAIACLTALYVCYSRKQWKTMESTLRAVQTQTTISQRQLEDSERAAVALGEVTLKFRSPDGLKFEAAFRNIGKFPAFDARIRVRSGTCSGPPRIQIAVPTLTPVTVVDEGERTSLQLREVAEGLFAPPPLPVGEDKFYQFTPLLRPAEIDKIEQGVLTLYVWAEIKFRDGLGDHLSHGCVTYRTKSRLGDLLAPSEQFVPCRTDKPPAVEDCER